MDVTVKTVKHGEHVFMVLCCREVWWEWWDWCAQRASGDVWMQKGWKGRQKKGVRSKHISGPPNQEEPAPRLKRRTNCKRGIAELFIERQLRKRDRNPSPASAPKNTPNPAPGCKPGKTPGVWWGFSPAVPWGARSRVRGPGCAPWCPATGQPAWAHPSRGTGRTGEWVKSVLFLNQNHLKLTLPCSLTLSCVKRQQWRGKCICRAVTLQRP